MFNLSGSEIVVILLLALVVLGPDKLPDAMRRAGKMWGELRKLSGSFQDEVRKGFEEPTRELRGTANAVKKAATFDINPLKDVKGGAKGVVKSLIDPPSSAVRTTAEKPHSPGGPIDVTANETAAPAEPVHPGEPVETAADVVAVDPAAAQTVEVVVADDDAASAVADAAPEDGTTPARQADATP